MDLSTLDMQAAAQDGATITLNHPVTDVSLDAQIDLVGADGQEFKAALDDARRRFDAQNKGKKNPTSLSTAEREAAQAKILARATTGWRNIEWEGKPLAFTAENCSMIYSKNPWIMEQVDRFIADRANFSQPA